MVFGESFEAPFFVNYWAIIHNVEITFKRQCGPGLDLRK